MTEPRRYVADTDLLVSSLLGPGSRPALATHRAIETGILLFSRESFAELAAVLMRPKFDRYVTVAERENFLLLLGRISREIAIIRPVRACRDPKDDKILEVAVNGRADALLTGDEDLLVLHPYLGIPILSPTIFLDSPRL